MSSRIAHLLNALIVAGAALGTPADATAAPPRRSSAKSSKAAAKHVESPPDGAHLTMTTGTVCASIQGFRQYTPLPDSTLTKHDKLLVYYEPKNYAVEREGQTIRVHFVQDVRVRRRGEKQVLWSRDKLFEMKAELPTPDTMVYLGNTIALKNLPPGEYDLDIILHDKIGPGQTADQTVRFRVKPSPPQPPPDEKQASEEPG